VLVTMCDHCYFLQVLKYFEVGMKEPITAPVQVYPVERLEPQTDSVAMPRITRCLETGKYLIFSLLSYSAIFFIAYVNRERTIALFRTSDSFVVQARNWLPNNVGGVVWFGPHAAHYTAYVPITISVQTSPAMLSAPYQGAYDESTSFWATRNIASLAQGKFSFMIKDIRETQDQLESDGLSLLEKIESSFANNTRAMSDDEITTLLTAHAEKARLAYASLLKSMMFKYADGYINSWVANRFVSVAAGNDRLR
jgi:dipeptidase